jgi:metallo-beta-lactamase class B
MRWLVLPCFALAACAASTTQSPRVDAVTTKDLPSCHEDAKWTEPAPPLHIYGNTWFVGTCGISSILITSAQGHVLIDGGVKEAAPLVEANIRALGFRVADVRYILNSHEHHDHAGAIAQLQHDSGAVVIAREPAARAFERGHGDRSDPQFLSAESFAPISNVRRIADGETLVLGSIKLTAHATPGHTPGSTTWTWESCERNTCMHLVYADSLTSISDDVYRYSDESAHPGVAALFRQSIATVAALPCDILLTPHPDASDMWLRLGAHPSEPLIDPTWCPRYATNAEKKLDARLAKERASH